jgi:anti-sigma factor (TIGR02949 family)
MTCEAAQTLLNAYVDDEMDPNHGMDLREHIASCSNCSAAYDHLIALRRLIKEEAPYYHAPEDLAGRIRQSLRPADDEKRGRFSSYWRLAAIAACLLLAVSFGFNLYMLRTGSSVPDVIAEEAVSSHIRALMGNRLVDVPSSDQHTVKPWFNGKIDFSPVVKDLSAAGFPLVGGRIDYVGDRAVASLVYQRRKHVLDLFIWPGTDRKAESSPESTINGYHVIRWENSGMSYCVVSDLNVRELHQFKQIFSE